MTTTSDVDITEGAGTHVATYDITEDAETKKIQRVAVNDPSGADSIGGLTEAAPATDTASSGLNGRLQRVAQRLTSLIALVPASLGAKAASASLAVTLATDDVLVAPIGGVTEAAPATDTASSGLNGRLQRIAQRLTTLVTGIVLAAGENHIGQVSSHQATCSTDVTRPSNATQYAANDAMADNSAAVGGSTFTGAARASGGSGVITDLIVTSSVTPTALALSGAVWVFDAAVTEIADNAAWALSAADIKKLVAVIPFLLTTDATGSYAHVQGLDIGFTCVGTANLRYLVKVLNAYTPQSAEVISCRLKVLQTT